MKHYFRIYFSLFRFSFIQNMAYSQDFLIWSAIDIVWGAVNIIFFKLLLLNVPNLSGWTFNELLLPLGIIQLLNAFMWGGVYSNMKNLVDNINKGTLDFFLSKPISSQFLVSFRQTDFNLFPSVIIGCFLTVYGLQLNQVLSLSHLLMIFLFLISGSLIIYSLWFISVTFAMWFGRLSNIIYLFPRIFDASRYPVSIFPPLVRFVLTFIVPVALVGFFPASIILGRLPEYLLALPAFGRHTPSVYQFQVLVTCPPPLLFCQLLIVIKSIYGYNRSQQPQKILPSSSKRTRFVRFH